ncbi:MAG: hypothetical protein LAO03_14545 [Acidobacteriia bacterium]|nr:hypothetical protein [Terriglobia bacterium]
MAIGFSNWTKEMCGNQPTQNQDGTWEISHQVPLPPKASDLNCSLDDNIPPKSAAWSFINKAKINPDVNPSLVFVDCAEIGAVAGVWLDDHTNFPPHINTGAYTNCNNILARWPGGGIDPAEVQVVLLKNADSGETGAPNPLPLVELPSSGFSGCTGIVSTPYDACILEEYLTQIAQNLLKDPPGDTYKVFSGVKQLFVHTRIDGHYANPDPLVSPLNPEPHAYETGFAVKWLIQAQVDDVNTPGISHVFPGPLDYTTTPPEAPWMDWGAYMWASDTRIPCPHCPIPSVPQPNATPLTWQQQVAGPSYCVSGGSGLECDFQAKSGSHTDNTHPSLCGRSKTSDEMMYFFCNSPYTKPWFTVAGGGCTAQHVPVPQDSCDGFGQGTDTTGD